MVKASDDVPTELLAEFDIQTTLVIYRGTEQEPEVKIVADIKETGQRVSSFF